MEKQRQVRNLFPVVVGVLLLAAVACSPNSVTAQEEDEDETPPQPALIQVVSGLESPTTITNARDGSDRLFILEQPGRIRVVEDGALRSDPFLDLTGDISAGGERGLLGLAFHPDFPTTNAFFVNYTDPQGTTVVASYRVSESDPDRADRQSESVLLTVEQPYGNHNGGGLAFGPDDYLYISLGDGGAGGDPHNHGQDTQTLLGTILRIDVDSAEPYGIPGDNPFADGSDGLPEIWAYGLRNPWRFSFDRETGDLWIADVGQNMWEEINLEPSSSGGGVNYGWNVMEASHCFEPSSGCDTSGLTLPVVEYSHEHGCSVTGGYVFRGTELPELSGHYVFGDYCSGTIWAAAEEPDGGWSSEVLLETDLRVSAFGEDEEGELYVADYATGSVYRLAPEQ